MTDTDIAALVERLRDRWFKDQDALRETAADALAALQAENERLRLVRAAALKAGLAADTIRNDALEEAAQVADDYDAHEIAAVIRALKKK